MGKMKLIHTEEATLRTYSNRDEDGNWYHHFSTVGMKPKIQQGDGTWWIRTCVNGQANERTTTYQKADASDQEHE